MELFISVSFGEKKNREKTHTHNIFLIIAHRALPQKNKTGGEKRGGWAREGYSLSFISIWKKKKTHYYLSWFVICWIIFMQPPPPPLPPSCIHPKSNTNNASQRAVSLCLGQISQGGKKEAAWCLGSMRFLCVNLAASCPWAQPIPP